VVRKVSLNTDRPLLGLSRDGLMAAYSDGVVLEAWNVQAGTQVGSLRDLSGDILSFCREPRKGWFAIGTKTGTLYLWDPASSPLPLAKVAAHAGPVEQLACSGQGRVATVGWNSAKIWNIDRLVKTQEQAELH
jgi:WD40 repeat protein